METTVIDAIVSQNNAAAVQRMKDMLSDKALDIVDAQRQAISQQMFGDAIGAEPVEEPEDTDSEDTEIDSESEFDDDEFTQEPEEEEDETDYGTD